MNDKPSLLTARIQEIAKDWREALALAKAAKKEGKQNTYAYQLNRADAFKLALTKIAEGVRGANKREGARQQMVYDKSWGSVMKDEDGNPRQEVFTDVALPLVSDLYPTNEQLDEALKENK